MNHKSIFKQTWLGIGLLLVLVLSACAPAVAASASPEATLATVQPTLEAVASEPTAIATRADESGDAAAVQPVQETATTVVPVGELTADEVEGILYMREEEKLAHDVYLELYQVWGLPIFQNIASSEATHTEAVRSLIERYALQDPALGQEPGQFTNDALQALYDELIQQGSQSLESALRVGAAIEEIDLLDLDERLAETDKADIRMVYENLAKGSRNHLRSFVSNLERQTGQTYEPLYLSQSTYDAIIQAEVERGRGRGRL
jgi:hypothetical protein